jgi:hypothetical protein
MSARKPKKLTREQSAAIGDKLAVLFFDFWRNKQPPAPTLKRSEAEQTIIK